MYAPISSSPATRRKRLGTIVAHERLFRLGTASNLTVFALDVVLIIALYVVLMPVNRSLALLATGWGLIETATLVVVTLSDFDVLRFLSGADYLHAFEANRLQALARLSLSAHADCVQRRPGVAGLRSTAFCYLWFKSRFIPRALAAWGMLASFLMGACAFSFIIFPELAKTIDVEIMELPSFLRADNGLLAPAEEITSGMTLVAATSALRSRHDTHHKRKNRRLYVPILRSDRYLHRAADAPGEGRRR
jgi:hypothetical protein